MAARSEEAEKNDGNFGKGASPAPGMGRLLNPSTGIAGRQAPSIFGEKGHFWCFFPLFQFVKLLFGPFELRSRHWKTTGFLAVTSAFAKFYLKFNGLNLGTGLAL
jgi:hypothetical protein